MNPVHVAAFAMALAGAVPSTGALAAAQPPLTEDGRLMLRRGELVTVELDAGLHIAVKSVEPVGPDGPLARGAVPKDGTLAFYLGKDSTGAFLRIENGSTRKLRYSAFIVVPRKGDVDVERTSICPVAPGAFGLETWPNDVVGLVVGPFAEVGPENNSCAE